MIHIELHGNAVTIGQVQQVIIAPYEQDTGQTQGPVTVGAAAVQLMLNNTGAPPFLSWAGQFRNTSTAGQRIGLGFANTVTIANAPIILEPGEVYPFAFISHPWWAIGSAASGEVGVYIVGNR